MLTMKKFPFCAEVINDDVLVCGFCGENGNKLDSMETHGSQMETGIV